MGVKLGFLVTLEAKDGKGEELGEFLRAGREFAAAEEETVTWYAFRIDPTHYGIFDTFASENGRQAHIAGPWPRRSARPPTNCWRAIPPLGRWTSSPSSKPGFRGRRRWRARDHRQRR